MDLSIIIALSVMGLLLIAVDFYIPGFILGSCGVVLMIVATVICAMHHSLGITMALAGAEVIAGGVAGWLAIQYFPQTALGQRMMLHKTLDDARATTRASTDLVNRVGAALTVLRPAGTAIIDGKRLDVVAESGMIERDSQIKVVAVDGSRIVVRKI